MIALEDSSYLGKPAGGGTGFVCAGYSTQEFAGVSSDFLDKSSSPKFGHSAKAVRQKKGHDL